MTHVEYLQWAKNTIGVDFSAASVKRRYELNSAQLLAQVQSNGFIATIPAVLKACASSYSRNHVKLLMDASIAERGPEWISKEYDSVVNKTFRLNVLRNKNYPDPPNDGWCTDDSLYNQIDDLVRTTIVARYLSGAAAIVEALLSAAAALNPRFSRRDSEHGYYGQHIYIPVPVTFTDSAFEPYEGSIDVEIQVTTQLQDALYDLTHRLYELRRVAETPDDGSWKWETASPRFKASYAGHALHLIEGMFEELVEAERARKEIE